MSLYRSKSGFQRRFTNRSNISINLFVVLFGERMIQIQVWGTKNYTSQVNAAVERRLMAAGSWKPCPPAGPCTPNCKSLLNDRFILLRLLIVFTSIHFIPSSKEGGRALGPWHLQSAPVLSPLTVMCTSNDTVCVCVRPSTMGSVCLYILCVCLFDKNVFLVL